MRIYADISSHDSTGVSGGRIVRTDDTPEEGTSTTVNGQFVFEVPEGVTLDIDSTSFWFPQSDSDSIPARVAAGMLVRYPTYDHVLFNFYLENSDVEDIETTIGATFPTVANTTPVLPTSDVAPTVSRCIYGRATGPGSVGMVPNGLLILPRSAKRASPVYGCVLTTLLDLWEYNPCYVDVDSVAVTPGDTILLGGVALTAAAGARTSGGDDFDGSLATAALVAADIVAAINDPANSFATFVVAQVDPVNSARVQLRPVPSSNTTLTVSSTSGDLTVVESHPGTDDVMLWWRVSNFNVSEDQGFAEQGPGAGENAPALKSMVEVDQELADLLVYVSVDDGASWYRANYMEPLDLGSSGSDLRVCFINVGSTPIVLQGFCVLFTDMLPPV